MKLSAQAPEPEAMATQGRWSPESFLRISDVSVGFGGLRALSRVSFDVAQGKITAVIGPNGAGKSTLFNVICGELRPASGTVTFRGLDITSYGPDRRCQVGISRSFQTPRLFPHLSCLENVMAARYTRTHASLLESILSLPRARREQRSDREFARELLDRLGIEKPHLRMPNQLSFGNLRRLEMARALATEPALLLMDEPSGGLASHVIDDLLEIVSDLAADGTTFLIVEHNMAVVAAVADKVIALNQGEKLVEGDAKTVLNSPLVVESYLGAIES